MESPPVLHFPFSIPPMSELPDLPQAQKKNRRATVASWVGSAAIHLGLLVGVGVLVNYSRPKTETVVAVRIEQLGLPTPMAAAAPSAMSGEPTLPSTPSSPPSEPTPETLPAPSTPLPKAEPAEAPVEPKKPEPKKVEPKRTEEVKKPEPKKPEPRKTEPKKAEPKKAESKKEQPKKEEPQKAESKKAEPQKEESKKRDSSKSQPSKPAEDTKENRKSDTPAKSSSRAESKVASNNPGAERASKASGVLNQAAGSTSGKADFAQEGSETLYADYLTNVHRIIRRYFRPPSTGTGTAVVRFMIARDGSVHTISLYSRSGNIELDMAALSAIELAASRKEFPTLPAGFPHDALPILFEFKPSM